MKDKLQKEIVNSFQFLLILFAAMVAIIISEIVQAEYITLSSSADAGHINIQEMIKSEMYFFIRLIVWFIVFTLIRLIFVYFSLRANFLRK